MSLVLQCGLYFICAIFIYICIDKNMFLSIKERGKGCTGLKRNQASDSTSFVGSKIKQWFCKGICGLFLGVPTWIWALLVCIGIGPMEACTKGKSGSDKTTVVDIFCMLDQQIVALLMVTVQAFSWEVPLSHSEFLSFGWSWLCPQL